MGGVVNSSSNLRRQGRGIFESRMALSKELVHGHRDTGDKNSISVTERGDI